MQIKVASTVASTFRVPVLPEHVCRFKRRYADVPVPVKYLNRLYFLTLNSASDYAEQEMYTSASLNATKAPTLAGLAVCWLVLSMPAHAGLIVAVGSTTVSAGATNQVVDVTLENTGLAAVTVDAFAFEVATSDTDITFSEANISTAQPYIFLNNSSFGPVISTPSANEQTVNASDLYSGLGDGAEVAAGATVGLGEIVFDIAPGATSALASLNLDVNGTSLSDIAGDLLPITLADGSIDVQASLVSTPEPSTFAPMALLLAAVCFPRKHFIKAS
jgi:hypothetical protein